jgi:hypothetical protein
MEEQHIIPASVMTNERMNKRSETLVVNIDACLDCDISIVEFRVDGKVHRFTTKQVSLFLSYVTEGLFE